MKKFLLLSLIFASIPYSANALSGDVAPADIMQVHDMQMLYEQRFRQEEVNDYKDIKEEKARFWKKNKTSEQAQQEARQQVQEITNQIQNQQNRISAPSKRSEFVEENGQLKIKYY